MKSLYAWAWGTVLVCVVSGCGEGTEAPGQEPGVGQSGETVRVSEELRRCSSSRSLVCGTDGRTYLNACRAGGASRVAHVGACAGFVCNGVVCASGFTCRTATSNYGVPVDQCVSDSGQPPSCSCASGSHCVQEPSGATHCEANVPPPPPPSPSTLCQSKVCPSGMHCAVVTFNYGVPMASCMFD
jgi:hypothetical protein